MGVQDPAPEPGLQRSDKSCLVEKKPACIEINTGDAGGIIGKYEGLAVGSNDKWTFYGSVLV